MVTRAVTEGTAEVVTDRSGACGGCDSARGCRSCLTSAKIVSTVQNPVGAKSGDVVTIDIASRGLWTGALLFYVFPVVCMLGGAAAGAHFGRLWFDGETGLSILFGLLGLAAGLLTTWLFSRSPSGNALLRPRISGIVAPSSPAGTGANPQPPAGRNTGCCGR
jgi:positive regulator of sigma E activity